MEGSLAPQRYLRNPGRRNILSLPHPQDTYIYRREAIPSAGSDSPNARDVHAKAAQSLEDQQGYWSTHPNAVESPLLY